MFKESEIGYTAVSQVCVSKKQGVSGQSVKIRQDSTVIGSNLIVLHIILTFLFARLNIMRKILDVKL